MLNLPLLLQTLHAARGDDKCGARAAGKEGAPRLFTTSACYPSGTRATHRRHAALRAARWTHATSYTAFHGQHNVVCDVTFIISAFYHVISCHQPSVPLFQCSTVQYDTLNDCVTPWSELKREREWCHVMCNVCRRAARAHYVTTEDVHQVQPPSIQERGHWQVGVGPCSIGAGPGGTIDTVRIGQPAVHQTHVDLLCSTLIFTIFV